VLNYREPVDREVDLIFQALGDPTRRLMLDRLSHGPASVSELARPLEMSLPAVVQHLHVLEHSGLVRSRKVGRVRTCSLDPAAVRSAEGWLSQRRRFWDESLDRLGEYLAETAEKSPTPQPSTKERKR
jgi:DNA-binding transcriptional ArsR family regulator